MATTVEPRDGTQPYVDADEYIDFQLAKTQSQIKMTEILTSAGWLGLAVLGYTLTFVILDQWVIPGGFGSIARALWLGVLLIGGGAWLTSRVLRPAFRTVHELYAAKMIESADPTLKSSLLNLIDLQIDGRKSKSALVRASMEKRAAVELSKVNVDQAIDRQTLLRVAYALLGMVVACSLYAMLSPKDAFSSVQRLLLPTANTAVATRTSIANITPEDTRVLAGELLNVEADILGQLPPQVTLFYTTADHEFVNQPVEMQRLEEGTRFRGVISGEKGRGLMQNITYRLEAGDSRTRDYNVQVSEPPSSKVEKVSYTFPAYMKLDSKVHPGGHIDAWEGTKLVVAASTNLPVQSALLVMTDTDNPLAKGEEVRMKVVNGKQLSAEWTLDFRSDGTFARYYHIECKTAAGESDPHPTVYSIKIQPDQKPDVSLLHPTQDLERPANAVVPLLVKASDPDFQLRFVTLRVEKAGEEILAAALLDEERSAFEGTHDLHLDKLSAAGLMPGDEILYWIEARDNKQPHGNRSATPRMKIKITAPAKAEQLAQQLEQDRQKQQEQAEQANQDRNPLEPERQPPEAAPEKAPRRKPDDKKPAPKPGDPKPREEARQPEEPQERPEGQPNEQQQKEGKAEAEQKPGQGANGKPQAGKNGQQQRQQAGDKGQGEKTQGEKQEGEGAAGEQTGEKSPMGQDGKAGNEGAASKQNDGSQRNSQNRKKAPADDQTALQELLKRQQENAESNPENPENNSQPGGEPQGDKTADGDKQSPMGSKQPSQETSSKNTKTQDGKTSNNGDEKQPSPDKSKAGQGQAQDKPGTEKPGTEKPNTPAAGQPKPGDQGEKQPQSADGKKSRDKNAQGDKQNAEPQPGDSKSGKNSPSKPDGKQPPGSEKSSDPSSAQGRQGEGDPNDKSMQKSENGQPAQQRNPAGKEAGVKDAEGKDASEKTGDEKSPDKAQGESGKDPKEGGNAKSPPTNKTGAEKAQKKADPQAADGKAGEGAAAPGDDQKSSQKARGSAAQPSAEKGPKNEEAPEQGPGNGQRPDPKKKEGGGPKPAGEKSSPEMTGEETPAEEGPNAQKRDATGKEKGPAVGQDKPEGAAPQAENDLERKPDSKRGAMREPEKNNPDVKPDAGSNAANSVKSKREAGARPDESMKKGAGKASDQAQPTEKGAGDAASQKEPKPGQGRPSQKTQRPDSSEKGAGTPQDQGTPDSKEQGEGNAQQKPGGEPGDKAGPGSKKQDGDKSQAGGGPSSEKQGGQPNGDPMPNNNGKPDGEGQPGDKGGGESEAGGDQPGKPGEPGAGKPGEGKPGSGKPGGQPGKGGNSPGAGPNNSSNDENSNDQPGERVGNGAGKPNPERRNLPPAERDQEAQEAAEKANEEFARKASSLVLKKLRKDLDRGEVDQDLLNELGWKQDDMERFVQRLEKQLQDPGDDTSPESVARRQQFEETLKSLGLSSKTKKRKAVGGKPTRVNELGDRKIAPPPEYQELFEEYTKDLSKPAASKK